MLSSDDGSKVICICVDAFKEVIAKVIKPDNRHKQFKKVVACIFRNQTNSEQYSMYPKFKGTSVMKISKGRENLRLYCHLHKEVIGKKTIQYITISKVHDKKVEDLSKKEVSLLEAIQKNKYEHKEWG